MFAFFYFNYFILFESSQELNTTKKNFVFFVCIF